MDEIIELFFKEPEKEYHVRDIAKRVGKSPTTISKYLKDFEKNGLLKSESKFNHLIFKANEESLRFKLLRKNYNLELLFNSGLIKFLVDEFNFPKAIFLFGSFAKGENNSKSDIDLLIISPLKKEVDLKKFEKLIGYEIQLFIYSMKEVEIMKTKNKELLNNFINGVNLYGYWEVFE